MSGQKRFEVVFEPDEGGGWHAYVPKVRGCRTHGRSLVAARRNIREALATCVDVLGDGAEEVARKAVLEERFALDGETRKALRAYRTARERAAKAQAVAQKSAAAVAERLTKRISLRDAGELLGLSHERVSQVMHAKEGR